MYDTERSETNVALFKKNWLSRTHEYVGLYTAAVVQMNVLLQLYPFSSLV